MLTIWPSTFWRSIQKTKTPVRLYGASLACHSGPSFALKGVFVDKKVFEDWTVFIMYTFACQWCTFSREIWKIFAGRFFAWTKQKKSCLLHFFAKTFPAFYTSASSAITCMMSSRWFCYMTAITTCFMKKKHVSMCIHTYIHMYVCMYHCRYVCMYIKLKFSLFGKMIFFPRKFLASFWCQSLDKYECRDRVIRKILKRIFYLKNSASMKTLEPNTGIFDF
jgi:hypothetical protein